MIDENLKVLISYRLRQADESLKAGKTLLKERLYNSAVNRAYYAMFYAVLALLASEKRETSKHSGAISLFDKEYVKTGIFPKGLSKWLHNAFDLRQRSDYTVSYEPSAEETEETLNRAVSFVQQVGERLKAKMEEKER